MHHVEMRERLFTMRMSAEESSRLEFLAQHFGLNAAGVIRMLLKKEEQSVRVELRRQGIGEALDLDSAPPRAPYPPPKKKSRR